MFAQTISPGASFLCPKHPDEEINNFCNQSECLLPLCPLCTMEHFEFHLQRNTRPDLKNFKNVRLECITRIQSVSESLKSATKTIKETFEYLPETVKIEVEKINKSKHEMNTFINNFYEKQLRGVNSPLKYFEDKLNIIQQEIDGIDTQFNEGIYREVIQKLNDKNYEQEIEKARLTYSQEVGKINNEQEGGSRSKVRVQIDAAAFELIKEKLPECIHIIKQPGNSTNSSTTNDQVKEESSEKTSFASKEIIIESILFDSNHSQSKNSSPDNLLDNHSFPSHRSYSNPIQDLLLKPTVVNDHQATPIPTVIEPVKKSSSLRDLLLARKPPSKIEIENTNNTNSNSNNLPPKSHIFENLKMLMEEEKQSSKSQGATSAFGILERFKSRKDGIMNKSATPVNFEKSNLEKRPALLDIGNLDPRKMLKSDPKDLLSNNAKSWSFKDLIESDPENRNPLSFNHGQTLSTTPLKHLERPSFLQSSTYNFTALDSTNHLAGFKKQNSLHIDTHSGSSHMTSPFNSKEEANIIDDRPLSPLNFGHYEPEAQASQPSLYYEIEHVKELDFGHLSHKNHQDKFPLYKIEEEKAQNLSPISSQSHKQPFREQYSSGSFKITQPDFFKPNAQHKVLHFFEWRSKNLHILQLDDLTAYHYEFTKITLTMQGVIPDFHTSLNTPHGEIYMLGGRNGKNNDEKYNEVYTVDMQNKRLVKKASMKDKRDSHASCYTGGFIYVIGGVTLRDNKRTVLRSCERYDIAKDEWTEIAQVNMPVCNHCACVFNEKNIFCFGGRCQPEVLSNYIFKYTIENNTWTCIKLMDHTQRFALTSQAACCQINEDFMFIFGGYQQNRSASDQSFLCTFSSPEDSNKNKGDSQKKDMCLIKQLNVKRIDNAAPFWDKQIIVHNGKIYCLQNEIAANNYKMVYSNRRRLMVFDGEQWHNLSNP